VRPTNGWNHVLFDLDGTLTDSAPGILNSIRYALGRLDRPVPDESVLRRFIGPPLRDSFRDVLGFAPPLVEQAITEYRVYFSDRGLYENALYPGVAELLTALRDRGVVLALATSKPQVFAERIVEHFDIARHFEMISGAALDGGRQHKPEIIGHALDVLGLAPDAPAVMVGDREHDVLGARAHDMASIGVTWGYGTADELRAAGVTAIAGDVAALSALLDR
jgi:phosphoglycolate phosphatase